MSEALRLAAVLEDEKMHSMAIDTEAAAELRRLHALNAELVEALRGLAGEVERFGLHHPDGNSNWWPVALEKAQAALSKMEATERTDL